MNSLATSCLYSAGVTTGLTFDTATVFEFYLFLPFLNASVKHLVLLSFALQDFFDLLLLTDPEVLQDTLDMERLRFWALGTGRGCS